MLQQSFIPPPRVLMGPGPSPVHKRVLQAMARPTIGHLDPQFIRLMDEIKLGLRAAFRTENAFTLPISAPASAGQEACIVNLLEPGDRFVACVNGVFGERMAVMAERAGAEVIRLQQPWGRAVDPEALRALLREVGAVKMVGFVHAETSTGAASDAPALTALSHEAGALALMDTVTGLGGIPVDIDAWGVDACYSGTQKCLSCPPGLSPVTFSARARDVILARRTPVRNWFLDLSLLLAYWAGEGRRSYHHTAPVNALYGLHEALLMLLEEGLPASWARHRRAHEALVAGLENMGLSLLVPPAERLPQLNTVQVPQGIDEAAARAHLLEVHGVEIGAGLGPMAGKIWRIGLMGQGARAEHVMTLLSALADALAVQGHKVDATAALDAAARIDTQVAA